MSTASPSLAALLAALTTAKTPADTATAAGNLYQATRPLFFPICTTLIKRAPGAPWLSAADLAQDTLVDALPALQRGACPNATNNGLLRWLATVAWRRLLTDARPQSGVSTGDIHEVLLGTHAANMPTDDVDDVYPSRDRAVWSLYDAVLDAQREAPRRTWVLIAEQDVPKTEAAAALGISRRTVYNHLTRVQQRLRTELAPYAP